MLKRFLDEPHPMTWVFAAGIMGGNAGWAASVHAWWAAIGFTILSGVLYYMSRKVADDDLND
jgi:membrane protein implicated in regulation of membrane protease activity